MVKLAEWGQAGFEVAWGFPLLCAIIVGGVCEWWTSWFHDLPPSASRPIWKFTPRSAHSWILELVLGTLFAGVGFESGWHDAWSPMPAHSLPQDLLLMLPLVAGLLLLGVNMGGDLWAVWRRESPHLPPLCAAARDGDLEAMRRLLSDSSWRRRRAVLRCDGYEKTALMHAAHNGHTEAVWVLLEHCDVLAQSRTPAKDCALTLAVEQNHLSCTALLIEAMSQVPVNRKKKAAALLQQAAWNTITHRRLECLSLFLRKGSPPKPDKEGQTPLRWAMHMHEPAIVERLLNEIAQEEEKQETATHLLDFGVEMNAKRFVFQSPSSSEKIRWACVDVLSGYAGETALLAALQQAPAGALPRTQAVLERRALAQACETVAQASGEIEPGCEGEQSDPHTAALAPRWGAQTVHGARRL